MFNVNGVARVTNLKEVSPRMIVGSVYTSEKVGDEWETTFVKAKFVGNGLQQLIQLDIKDKDRFVIEKGILKSNKYTNKNNETFETLEMTIFELKKFEEKQDEPKATTSKFKR